MRANVNRYWVLRERPTGLVTPAHFDMRESPVREPADGEAVVRVRMLSIDPANRAWMFPSPTYKAPVAPGDTMHGFGVGEIVASRAQGLKVGDIVEGMVGWQDYAVLPVAELAKRDIKGSIEHAMGVLGVTGLTAYFGLVEIGRPKAGETLLVSAAAGAVGSIVAQIGRILGCRVVGIAGGPDKCAWLQRELGLDAAIDYRQGGLRKAVRSACSNGVDVYFDNTGGEALDAALFAMNERGRIVCCGNLSQYNADRPAPGPVGVPGLLVTKRLRMEGFVVLDYFDRREPAERQLKAWLDEGKLKSFETIVEGLENAPRALQQMFEGYNLGKLIVRL